MVGFTTEKAHIRTLIYKTDKSPSPQILTSNNILFSYLALFSTKIALFNNSK